MKLLSPPAKNSKINSSIQVPPDKSIAQRSVIFSSIAKGESIIKNFPIAGDPQSTLKVYGSFGVKIEQFQDENGINNLRIAGKGIDGLKEPNDVLNCDNSGTCMRLTMGLLSGLPTGLFSVLTGDASLRKRPMRRIVQPLISLGAHIEGANQSNNAPLSIIGRSLNGGEIKMKVASAQLKSALILASMNASSKLLITEPEPSRNHSEIMLSSMGLKIVRKGQNTIEVHPGEIEAKNIEIPGDPSSAAFMVAACLMLPESKLTITNVGLNPTRTGYLEVLRSMGAKINTVVESSEGEPIGRIEVEYSDLKGTEIKGEIIPNVIDELPILSLIAARAEGTTVIRDAAELRVKESDRLAKMAEMLKNLGVKIEELEDGLIIEGMHGAKFNPTDGYIFDSAHDHRIAMTLGTASLATSKEFTLNGSEWADVSFPGFFKLLESIVCNNQL
jgi:3-phosphoshikimate 1-carboxyvinyltransferase